MNLKNLKTNTAMPSPLVTLLGALILIVSFAGCAQNTVILREEESYYLIPSGVPFMAQVDKEGTLGPIEKPYPMYAVSASYLVKLQEEANEKVLGKK